MGWPYQQKPPMGWPLDPDSGLIPDAGFWYMPEGSGNKVFDLSGNGNDGTFVNDPAWSSDSLGPAVDFDGGDDDINCGNKNSIRLVNNFSVFVWVNLDTAAGVADYEPVVCRYDTSADKRVWWLGTHDSDWSIYLSNSGDGASGVEGESGIVAPTGSLTVVGFTYNGTICRLYQNGVEIFNFSPSVHNGSLYACDEIFQIGGYNGGNMDGKDSVVYACNKVLYPYEIALLSSEPFCMFKDPAEIAFWGSISAPSGAAPTSTIYGPLVGSLGGPI